MWDTVQSTTMVLSHDMPCAHCGHALHVYLECGDGCDCAPQVMPGQRRLSSSVCTPSSGLDQHLDRAPLVHRAVALGDLVERQRRVEDAGRG